MVTLLTEFPPGEADEDGLERRLGDRDVTQAVAVRGADELREDTVRALREDTQAVIPRIDGHHTGEALDASGETVRGAVEVELDDGLGPQLLLERGGCVADEDLPMV